MSSHLDKLKKLQQLGNTVNDKVMHSKPATKTNEKPPLTSKPKTPSKEVKIKSTSQSQKSIVVKKLYSLNLNVRHHKLIALHCKINGISMSSLFNDFSQDYVTKHKLEEKYKTFMTDSD